MPTISGLRCRTVLLAGALFVAAPALTEAQMAPVRVGGNIATPQKIRDVRPVYPDEALGARVSGVVILEITVDEAGRVSDAKVLRSIPLLDRAAVEAVRQWEYTPTLLNGVPVPIVMTVTVDFNLNGPTGAPPNPRVVGGVRGGVVGGVTGDSFSTGWSMSAGRGSEPVMTSSRPGFVDYYELTNERRSALPQWDPAVTYEPPLSPGAALSAAHGWVQQRYPERGEFRVMELSLARGLGTWLYRLRLGPPIPARGRGPGAPRPNFAEPVMIIVLLDGSVLEPRTEKRPQ